MVPGCIGLIPGSRLAFTGSDPGGAGLDRRHGVKRLKHLKNRDLALLPGSINTDLYTGWKLIEIPVNQRFRGSVVDFEGDYPSIWLSTYSAMPYPGGVV